MFRLLCVLSALVFVLPLWADDDDRYISENTAKSLRQPRPREERREMRRDQGPGKKSDNNKARETFSADDVKKIMAAKGKDVIVRGKVHEVYIPQNGSVLIMNFGKNHRECFKAVIFKRNFDKWEGGKDAIKKLVEGKEVTIEGVVSDYRDMPQIAITVPSQIKMEK